MSDFRTECSPTPLSVRINRSDTIFMIGSCFTTEIADQLSRLYYNVCANPFGVVFNPHTIQQLLTMHAVQEAEMIQIDQVWYHWWMNANPHAHTDKSRLTAQINEAIAARNNSLNQARWLIITLGTSFVYEHLPSGQIVGNCHKTPAKAFRKRLLTVDEVSSALGQTVAFWRSKNQALNVLFTISPVRHLKDGFHENNLSKATLHLAVNALQQAHENVFYFPAFELLNDDLRDYRYYANDMLHPSATAVQYIWKKFQQTCLPPTDHTYNQTIESYLQLLQHRVQHPSGTAYQKYLEQLTVLKQKVEHITGQKL